MRVALGTACGFLAGVLLVIALGGVSGETTTKTVTVAPKPAAGGRVITTTEVPDVIGARLDVAKQRIRRAGFDVSVSGGGVLGVLDDTNWRVIAQDPPGGNKLEQGSAVTVDIDRG